MGDDEDFKLLKAYLDNAAKAGMLTEFVGSLINEVMAAAKEPGFELANALHDAAYEWDL